MKNIRNLKRENYCKPRTNQAFLAKRLRRSCTYYLNSGDLIKRESVESGGQTLVFNLNSGNDENIGLDVGIKSEPSDNLHLK